MNVFFIILCWDDSVGVEPTVSVLLGDDFKKNAVVAVERAIICVKVLVRRLICNIQQI